jgi:hypothetical protein
MAERVISLDSLNNLDHFLNESFHDDNDSMYEVLSHQ